jgi:hypothetical protein
MLIFVSPSAAAAWVVGPFSAAECEKKTQTMAQIVPSPIEGGHRTGAQYGPPELIARDLMYVFHCAHQDMPGMNAGPDGILGIYMCAGP